MNHLNYIKNESIEIIRETYALHSDAIILYSIGKDSTVLLHLAAKAFYPKKIPFRCLHIDTGWKFKEMIKFRDSTAEKLDIDLMVLNNPEGLRKNINPIEYDAAEYTKIMKTDALKQAIEKLNIKVAIGGARRDEEASRAKERIISVRNSKHQWDPYNQRPELWNLYNLNMTSSQSLRVFPLSNWTELDIWKYIEQENIDVVPLYFSKKRPVIEKGGKLIMLDDERYPVPKDHIPRHEYIRFRSLGCYPLSSAIKSDAFTVKDIIAELESTNSSERSGRLIDHTSNYAMETMKKDGYF